MSVIEDIFSGRDTVFAFFTRTHWEVAFGKIVGVERVEVDEEVGRVRITVHLRKGFIARQVRRQCEALVCNHAPMWLDIGFTIVEHNSKPWWPKCLGYHMPPRNLDIDEVIYLRSE
jgi:hypothetical protein